MKILLIEVYDYYDKKYWIKSVVSVPDTFTEEYEKILELEYCEYSKKYLPCMSYADWLEKEKGFQKMDFIVRKGKIYHNPDY